MRFISYLFGFLLFSIIVYFFNYTKWVSTKLKLPFKSKPSHFFNLHSRLDNSSKPMFHSSPHGAIKPLIATHKQRFHHNNSDMQWAFFLRQYVENVHNVGLSPLAMARPRWVVAAIHPLAGMCNRIMHLISSLAFAMATGRVLLFDWSEIPSHKNGVEDTGHSNFNDLFQSHFEYSYTNALRKFGWTDQQMHRGSLTIVDDNTDFLRALRFSDLDSLYPQSVIFIERYDWWGAPLVMNPLYAHSVFLLNTASHVFSILFKFLFSPRTNPPQNEKCDWLIQRRAKWDRPTAPLSNYMACAHLHYTSHPHAVLITDVDTADDPNNSNLVLKRETTGCRTGLACDLHAVRQMHAYSKCKNAVLTATSTFGACIAGLGEIQNTYVVHGVHGTCHKRQYVDPVDAGVLDHQKKQISEILQLPDANGSHFAFVLLMFASSDKAIHDLKLSLQRLHEHFNHRHHYPLVIFVDNASKWQHLQFENSARIHLVPVDQQQWNPPIQSETGPDIFRLRNIPTHRGFDRQYRQMSRWAAGYMLGHPVLEKYEYVIKMDSDTFAYAPWHQDPFVQMQSKKAVMGFWISYEDIPDVTEGLWEAFVAFVKLKGFKKLTQPGLLMHPDGHYRNTNLYGCFIGAQTQAFRTIEYKELFEHFDRLGGFFKYRWDEQKIFAFYVALYLTPEQVEYFDYVSIDHQEWARTASQIQISNAPTDAVLHQIFGFPTV